MRPKTVEVSREGKSGWMTRAGFLCMAVFVAILASEECGAQSETDYYARGKYCGEQESRCVEQMKDFDDAEAARCSEQLRACIKAAAGEDDANTDSDGDRNLDAPQSIPTSDPTTTSLDAADTVKSDSRSPRCKAALEFLESPSGLLGEWDKLVRRYPIHANAISDFQRQKNELMTLSTRWATSSGPEIAAAIKTTTDLVSETFATVSPGGKAIDTLKDFSSDFAGTTRAQRAEKLYEIVEKAGDVRSAVQGELSDFLVDKFLEHVGQIGAIVKLLKDTRENIQQMREIPAQKEQLVHELQSQLDRLDRYISDYQAQMASGSERMEFITTYQTAVTRLCAADQQKAPTVAPLQ